VQLLVSVADAADAAAAIDGGADIIDAKDPSRGALGPVTPATLAEILATVAGRRPVSIALGDHGDSAGDSELAASLPNDIAFVKIDFWRASRAHNLVLAAYADAPGYERVIDAAIQIAAKGVLLDTRDKNGPGLFGALREKAIARWVERAHDVGLTAALAGRLGADDIPRVQALGADIAGVRGAVCEGGRNGRVSAEKVRQLVGRVIAQRRIAETPGYFESANT
jgi:(5-formylfuran-3-yl)methyl phosphate synthase